MRSEESHAVVIQDDAIVCQNFEPIVELLARIHPENPVCLFYPGLKMRGQRTVQKAIMAKRSHFILDRQDFVPVVAVLWPRAKAESLLAWSKDRIIPGLRPPYRSDDAVTGAWMRHTKTDVICTLPSLVQHPDDVEPVKDGPHKAGHGADKGRIALSFCESDPLELDWSL